MNVEIRAEAAQFDPGNILIAHRHTNVEIRAEAAQFLFWEYINGIYVAVQATTLGFLPS